MVAGISWIAPWFSLQTFQPVPRIVFREPVVCKVVEVEEVENMSMAENQHKIEAWVIKEEQVGVFRNVFLKSEMELSTVGWYSQNFFQYSGI
jgi:hypothetical protein